MPGIITPSVSMLCVIMLCQNESVIKLSVIMLSVFIPNVMAPFQSLLFERFVHLKLIKCLLHRGEGSEGLKRNILKPSSIKRFFLIINYNMHDL
jgi:hypothetical protein